MWKKLYIYKKKGVAEMRILIWISGKTRKYMIWNEEIHLR